MHSHNNLQHTVIMSPSEPDISEALHKAGVQVLSSQCIDTLRKNEQYHADMQVCIIGDTAFIPSNCMITADKVRQFGYNVVLCNPIEFNYPKNVSVNVALAGNQLLCKESAVASEIKIFCKEKGIEIINVNQGYSKCSTLVLNDNAIITSDETITKAAHIKNIDVLKISPGNIHLQDADYGFIGGCSGRIGDTIYFFGDINTHPDYKNITAFIEHQRMKYISLTNGIMKDIGGFVCLT